MSVLDAPAAARPDPDELVRAAMRWHFDPDTGSPFWLRRAGTLGFDPRADVRGLDDLRLFPNVAAELRDVPVDALVPRGYGGRAEVVGVFDSGGTTGAPKRIVLLRDWMDRMVAWSVANMTAHGFPRGVDWLGLVPTGPHVVGEYFRRFAREYGRYGLTIDLDPRWVKRLIAGGQRAEADAYAEHLVDQAAHALRTQDIGVLTITPPLLERLARRDDLVELVEKKIRAIRWGGTQLDPDSRHLLRTEVFPHAVLCGQYGSTTMLGLAPERAGGADQCVFDPPSPFVTARVVDPATGAPVPYGARGQVVISHVSRSFLLPNNLERDLATRVPAPDGAAGDAVADVAPVPTFEDEAVVEGVY